MGRTSVELQVYTNIPNFTSDHIYITRMSSAKEPGKEITWRLYLLLYIRYITRVLLIELHEFIVYDFSVAISVSVSKECAANSSMGCFFFFKMEILMKSVSYMYMYIKSIWIEHVSITQFIYTNTWPIHSIFMCYWLSFVIQRSKFEHSIDADVTANRTWKRWM